jgi:hypothetical protein
MSRLRKILFWLGGIVALLLISALVFVWVGLGVNPFEGRQNHLYELTSSEVNFYVRFPGTRLLDDPVIDTLANEDGFEGLADLRDQLDDLTQDLAEQTAGQIPFLDKIDFQRDIAGNEMAIGGAIMGDYHQLKVDNFVLLTRISTPIKFVSALKRGFVRNQIPEAKDITLIKGLYFRIKVDPEVQDALDSFRSVRGGNGERDVLYMARIKDVLLISDSDAWIEHAIYGRKDVLRADAWFETQFTRSSIGGDSVEAFFRLGLTSHTLQAHSREPGSLINVMEKLLPIEMAGDVFMQMTTSGSGEIQISIDDLPGKKSFGELPAHLQRLYDEEKVDIATEMGPEGLGRFIPRRRVVGAMVLRAESRELVDMVLNLLPDVYRDFFDKEVRNSSNGRYPDFERLMRHLTEDLGDTHLLIFHRPSVFEDAAWHLFVEPDDQEPLPKGQLSFSIVSRVKDSVSPAAIEKRIAENLAHLGLNSAGTNKEFNFRKASPIIREEELEIFDPAFGALGGRYVFFSSMWEAAEALHDAAKNPESRMVTSPDFRRTLASMPHSGTLGLVVDGKTLAKSMYDGVRTWATQRMGVAHERGRRADKLRLQGVSEDAIHKKLNASIGAWKQERYEELRGEYEKLIEPIRALDSLGLVASLGVGPHKKVTADLRIRLRGATDTPTEE